MTNEPRKHIEAKAGSRLLAAVLLCAMGGCQTPEQRLFSAVAEGDRALVLALIQKGADVNARDSDLRTPLHRAASSYDRLPSLPFARLLIAKGAEVDARDELGQTPLHLASSSGRRDVVELLVEHGADVNALTQGGETPLAAALRTVVPGFGYRGVGSLRVASYLIRNGADVNAGQAVVGCFSPPSAPLYLAVMGGDADLVEQMIRKGARVNVGDKYRHTPLHAAVYRCSVEIAKLLLENGAEVNAVAEWLGEAPIQPIHLAAIAGAEEMVELLLARGADVEAKGGDYNATALLHAAHLGQPGVAKVLLAGGANVNAKDAEGATPLHRAVEAGHVRIIQLLMKYGADLNSRNLLGQTPLMCAKEKGYTDIVDLLRRRGTDRQNQKVDRR